MGIQRKTSSPVTPEPESDFRATSDPLRQSVPSIGIGFSRSDGRLVEPNGALLEMIGITQSEYEKNGLNWQDLIAGPINGSAPVESELIRKDGGRIPVLITRADVSAAKQKSTVTFLLDLRQSKQADDAQRRTEAALRAANDSLEDRVRERTAALEAQSAQLRALALDLTETESRERRRLAQVLHDHFQQLLSAAKMKIGVIRRRSPNHPELPSLKETEHLLEDAINASRSLAVELSPPVLHDTGLSAALEWLGRRMQQNHNLTVELHLEDCREPASEQVRIILFECVRELLFNVMKHAGIQFAELRASMPYEGLLQISVVDHGAGFDSQNTQMKPKPDGSFGLFSIRERIGLIGGLVKVVSSPGHGARVDLTVPMAMQPPRETRVAERQLSDVIAAMETANRTVRVLVADDHKLFREGLISLLNQEPYLHIVGEAGDGQEAVDLARKLRPDILIVDVTMPKLNGVEVTAIVSKEIPEMKIIGLSMHERDDMAKAMYNAGAAAYCAKSAPIESLVSILRNAAAVGEPSAT